MHTTFVIIAGLALLGLCLGVAHVLGGAAGMVHGASAFLPLWLVASGINMYVGLRGGRSAAEETENIVAGPQQGGSVSMFPNI